MIYPSLYYNLSKESQKKVEELAGEITEMLAKKDLNYNEAVATLELAQEGIKERKLI